jgi:hypothetical protein
MWAETVPAETAEITKCHVIFIVFFREIEIAGGDGTNQFLLKILAFVCVAESDHTYHQKKY